MEKKLGHIPRNICRKLERVLRKKGVVAESLYDLRQANVPVRHHFELNTKELIHSKRRRVSPKQNKVIWNELQEMLEAGIIIP